MENKLSPELKAFYDTELLENARCEYFYTQFAKRLPLPLHHDGTFEFRKWNTFDRVAKMTSGVIPTGQKFGVTTVETDVICHESTTEVNDTFELRSYDDLILSACEECGVEMADIQELLIRECLLTNENVLYCDNVDSDWNPVEPLRTPNKCSEMCGNLSARSTLTPSMVMKAVSIMKKNRVPRINGRYYAVVHPAIAEELRGCDGWIDAFKYACPEELFNGEIGELYGVRFIENANAPILGDGDYASMDGTVTCATYFFGNDSFGIIDPDGGGAEMIIQDKHERGLLEQKSKIGFRFETNGATIIYPERLLRVMSCPPPSAGNLLLNTPAYPMYLMSDPIVEPHRMNILRGKEREDPNVFVGINGVNYLLPKGKTSMVGPYVAHELCRASVAAKVFQDLKGGFNNAEKQDGKRED